MNKSPVININNIDVDKILLNPPPQEPLNYKTIDKLKYKFNENIEGDFNIFVNWTKIKIMNFSSNGHNSLYFKFIDNDIINIINKITLHLNLEHSGSNAKFSSGYSIVELHPSKKSNLPIYQIKKPECFSQINTYFPFHHNKNFNINIMGKFILKAFVVRTSSPNSKSYISLRIVKAEIKYEHSFAKDEGIKLESIYNNHINITI
jgi:hypothetical protein